MLYGSLNREDFKIHPFLFACQPAVRPISAKCMGPVYSYKKGDCYLNMNPLN